jgi:hypothetical protein
MLYHLTQSQLRPALVEAAGVPQDPDPPISDSPAPWLTWRGSFGGHPMGGAGRGTGRRQRSEGQCHRSQLHPIAVEEGGCRNEECRLADPGNAGEIDSKLETRQLGVRLPEVGGDIGAGSPEPRSTEGAPVERQFHLGDSTRCFESPTTDHDLAAGQRRVPVRLVDVARQCLSSGNPS